MPRTRQARVALASPHPFTRTRTDPLVSRAMYFPCGPTLKTWARRQASKLLAQTTSEHSMQQLAPGKRRRQGWGERGKGMYSNLPALSTKSTASDPSYAGMRYSVETFAYRRRISHVPGLPGKG